MHLEIDESIRGEKNGAHQNVKGVRSNVEDKLSEATPARKPLKISTVSHTLAADVAERLRFFAFQERISESAVIEFALRDFFDSGDNSALGTRLRDAGAALRRKS